MSWIKNPFTAKLSGIGVDISGPVIRLAQLGEVGSRTELVALGEAELPVLADVDPFADESKISKAIQDVMSRPLFGKFTARLAVASLPEHRCFVRVIHVQALSDEEIAQAIPFEAESYIPLPMDQVCLDWRRIAGNDGRTALLLTAAPKDLVNKIISVIELAGLVPAALEVESVCLLRGSLPDSVDPADTIIVDIGTNRTDLVVAEQGSIRFSSNIPMAEISLITVVAQELGLSKAQAALVVRKYGVNNVKEYPNLKSALLPVIKSLASEVDNVVTFHAQHSKKPLSKILLVGRGGGLAGFDVALKAELKSQVEVVVGDPWKAVGVDHVPEEFLGIHAVRFTAAIGLAARTLGL